MARQPSAVAERVLLRYAPATDTVSEELATDRYAAFLRTAEAGPVAPGDEWHHFVNCGCGSTQDVVLTVEAVEAGDRVGEATAFTFVSIDNETADDTVAPPTDRD